MQREDALYTMAKADLAHGKAGLRAAATRNDHALKCLQAFLVAFLDLHVYADAVARHELRNVGALGLGQKFFDDQVSHDLVPRIRNLEICFSFFARNSGQQFFIFVAQRGAIQQVGPVAQRFLQSRAPAPAAYFFMIA